MFMKQVKDDGLGAWPASRGSASGLDGTMTEDLARIASTANDPRAYLLN
jgi:hypothetical protein